MIQFLKLAETLRARGRIALSNTGVDVDSWWKSIENCQPVVFSNSSEGEVELSRSFPMEGPTLNDIDAPFPVFSIEMLNGSIWDGWNSKTTEGHAKAKAIVCREVAPRKFEHMVFFETEKGQSFIVASPPGARGVWQKMDDIIKEFMRRVSVSRMGVESVRQRVAIGSGKETRVARIRRIVHVCPKNKSTQYAESLGREIDWSHRWLVRGHWRVLLGRLGKDREGRYCVKDWTWTRDHEKGPEGLPLVAPKTRLVSTRGAIA